MATLKTRPSLTDAISKFPNGLVLIENEEANPAEVVRSSSSTVISQDVLFLAQREAKRLREKKSAPISPAIKIISPRPVTAPPRKPERKILQPSGTQTLKVKSLYSLKNSPSKIETFAPEFDLTEQLQHLREEMESLCPALIEEMPSEVADLDTAFDDESKRWFARELYSLKLECQKVKRLGNAGIEKQVTQLIKLHRTTLRLIEVAASRPILRILNPHIYSDLGGLVRQLVKLSDFLDLPAWDAELLLTALEEAILFPSRKSSNQKLANPGDIAGLLKVGLENLQHQITFWTSYFKPCIAKENCTA